MILLLPYITPAVMGAAVFFIIFGKAENSLLNEFISFFGYDPQLWLFDKRPITEVMFGLKIVDACSVNLALIRRWSEIMKASNNAK